MAKKTTRGVIPTEAPSDTPPHISVIAEGVDEARRRYFLLGVEGKPDPKLPPMLASRFSDDQTRVSSALTNAGVNLISSTAKTAFFKSVQEWGKKEPRFRVANKMGWHGGNYVLPDVTIGPNKNIYPSLAELDSDVLAKYRVRNSLPDWQTHVGRLCVNNSRLMFAVSLAFTGPILRFVSGVRSGGFQIYGDAETGKSTAAMVAGSVWGCHLQADNGFIETWNTTANKVEITALAHNDGLLILDETKNAGSSDPRRIEVVKDVVMRLAEQREKNRLPNATANRSWRCFFLSYV
jgi:putative DNA primase/helicase